MWFVGIVAVRARMYHWGCEVAEAVGLHKGKWFWQ